MAVDEATWIARARAGDEDAFAALYARYERRIYTFTYRMMGNADDALELTQETFLKAYRALEKTGDDLHFNAWLHRIAENVCLSVLRRRRVLRWVPWEADRHECPTEQRESDPQDAVIGDETRRVVAGVLEMVSPRHRHALILREFDGLPYRDIAQSMGIPVSSVKSLLFRARAEFRRCYTLADGPRAHLPPGRLAGS